jgi:hypothetical protein
VSISVLLATANAGGEGAAGMPACGTALANGAENPLVPLVFFAFIHTQYVVPFVNPVIVAVTVGAGMSIPGPGHCEPPGVFTMLYQTS